MTGVQTCALPISRNTFYNPSYVNDYKNWGIIEKSNFSGAAGSTAEGGMFTNGAGSAAITQIGYVSDTTPLIGGSYGIAFAYTYSQNLGLPSGTPLALAYSDYCNDATGYSSGNNFGVSGYWQPSQSGLIPSVSWGVGTGTYNIQSGAHFGGGQFTGTTGVTIASWYTGLQWTNVLVHGNDFGMAVGQAPYVTQLGTNTSDTPRSITDSTTGTGSTGANDSNYMWEWWYKVQVTDNITVTETTDGFGLFTDKSIVAMRVNGELRQSSTTGNMIWTCAQLIHFFSRNFTLKPGMVIITGTPSGTAWSCDAELGGKWHGTDGMVPATGYLKDGDEIICEIEGIGRLSNPIVETRR